MFAQMFSSTDPSCFLFDTQITTPFVSLPGSDPNVLLKLKAFRRIATRYDKLAATYLGFICIASILIWLK